MKNLTAFLLTLFFVVGLVGCDSNKLIEGSEKTYLGTVTDRGMSVVNEGERKSRPYIIISSEDEEGILFWLEKRCENPAAVGDRVIIESAIEEKTNLLVAISIKVE